MIDLAPDGPTPPKSKGPPRPESRKPLAAPPPHSRSQPHQRGLLGTAVLLGFIATAAGGAWLWQQQQDLAARVQPAQASVGPAAIAALEGRLDTLQQRQVQLERRPAPAPLDPLEHRLVTAEARLTQLEQRPTPPPLGPLDDRLGTLEQRLAQLEQRPAPPPLAPLEERLGTLEQRLAQLEQRPAPAPSAPPDERVGTLEQRLAQLEQRPAPPPVVTAADVAPLQQRLAQAEQAITTGATRSARFQAIAAALDAGRPLGDLPGGPPALTRFSTASPPTEASLKLSFPAAAGAALLASDPATTGLSVPWRMWQQVQTLLTIRQGDRILVGAPASGVLAQAQARLDAGDLAGAVTTLDQLDTAAAKAMAGWREQAQSLLDARAALAGLARS